METNKYGAVVKHIEPHHLNNVLIPNPPPILKQEIHNLIEDSFRLRDESNDLMDYAQDLLKEALQLPRVEKLRSQAEVYDDTADVYSYSVPLAELDNRVDASYHDPLVQVIEQHLREAALDVMRVGDRRISQSIVLPGRFKRHYVEEENGIVFFGGKQIYQLDPENKKYLSRSKHSDRIDRELQIHSNTTMITCSGTIAKVAIVPSHWSSWILNQHVIRVVPATEEIAGYLYAWLSSDYAHPLIIRYTYGAVVDEIDDEQVAQISIPLLRNSCAQERINSRVLEANAKRATAYELEQKALSILNDEVIYAQSDAH